MKQKLGKETAWISENGKLRKTTEADYINYWDNKYNS